VIRLLVAFLFVWEPVRVARELTTTLGSFDMRGPVAVVEILAHGAVAALTVAAAQALSNRNPLGPALAGWAVAVSAAADVQALYWSVLPGQTMPGDRGPLALVAIANAAGWLAYLWKSDRVRALRSGSIGPPNPAARTRV
jgi:hypothetical protein